MIRPAHRRLLELATAQPQLPKRLARVAGYRSVAYIRQALGQLARLGKLVRTPLGYRLPSAGQGAAGNAGAEPSPAG